MKQNFKVGDVVMCRKAHEGEPDGPCWHPTMYEFVGVTGIVCKIVGDFINVEFEELAADVWMFALEWLELVQITEDEMSTADRKVKETFTTTWQLDITLTDGKVTAVNVQGPKKEEPKKPKFAAGDIVVCKIMLQTLPTGIAWSHQMTQLLNVPGRVCSVGKWVEVEFPGQIGTWSYPEGFLEHETSEMTVAMHNLFSRIDKERTIAIGKSS